jgi:uncharacterized lipoprotein YajG
LIRLNLISHHFQNAGRAFMHSSIGLSVAALALIAGCATTDNNQASATSDAAPAKVCETQYRVGSNIPNRDCRAAMTEDERQRTRDEIRNSLPPSPGRQTGGGG